MGPAVEEVQNGRIQKRDVLKTDNQEARMMVIILHMEIEAHMLTTYSRFKCYYIYRDPCYVVLNMYAWKAENKLWN